MIWRYNPFYTPCILKKQWWTIIYITQLVSYSVWRNATLLFPLEILNLTYSIVDFFIHINVNIKLCGNIDKKKSEYFVSAFHRIGSFGVQKKLSSDVVSIQWSKIF